MSGINFEVEDVGTPNLVGEGEKPPEPEPSFGQPPTDPAAVVGEWTPSEVSQIFSSLMTGGLMVAYVIRRMEFPGPDELGYLGVAPEEMPATGQVFLPLFNRFLPKAMGGSMVAAGASVLPALGEVGIAIGRRAPLLQKKVQPPAWLAEQQAKRAQEQQPNPAPIQENGPQTEENGKFAFGKEFAGIIPTESPLVGMGI